MEGVDLKLVECFHGVIQRKRCTTLYFNTLGQSMFSKCASKGLDANMLKEYMIGHLVKYNFWQMMVSYCERTKRVNLGHQSYLKEGMDEVMKNLLLFQRLKRIDEEAL